MSPHKSNLLIGVETLLVFILVITGFHRLCLLGSLRSWETQVFGSRLVVEYFSLLLFTPLLLALARRSFIAHGLSVKPINYHIRIFGATFLPIFLLNAALAWVNWRQWPGALAISAGEIGLLALTAVLLRTQPEAPACQGMLMGLVLPLLAAPLNTGQARPVLLNVVYYYLLVGPAEEMFFRGYIQSRMNLVFGKPFCSLGISWGWGLIATSVLFGLWHAGRNPFSADVWPQVLLTTFAGLIFGIVREKSGSVTAPALLHGVLNYGLLALFYEFFFK